MVSLEKAIRIAAYFHEGQADKVNEPYILHVLRVMMQAKNRKLQRVAALHDLLEKTDCSRKQLEEEGFDDETIRAVEVLSRMEGEPENVFLERIKMDPVAIRIKIFDIRDQIYMLGSQADCPEIRERIQNYGKQLEELQIAEESRSGHGAEGRFI